MQEAARAACCMQQHHQATDDAAACERFCSIVVKAEGFRCPGAAVGQHDKGLEAVSSSTQSSEAAHGGVGAEPDARAECGACIC